MNREQVMLDKLLSLLVEKQQESLDLVEQFLRQTQALAKQSKLLTWDKVEAEISDRQTC